VLAVCHAWRRELQWLRVRIRTRDGNQLERPLVLSDLLEGGDLTVDCIAGLIRPLQPTE
jgi:hypothetical protein